MKHEYDYADIDAYIRQANQLRSEALGQILSQGWTAFKQACRHLTSGVSRAHAGHGGHGLAT